MDIIINDENVFFAWSIVSASWQEEEAQAMKIIAEHWITLRGFSCSEIERNSKVAPRPGY